MPTLRLALLVGLAASSLFTVQAWADARPHRGELPVHAPWLRQHLPEDAVLYARVPSLLGLLAMPKGSALDSALRSRTNIDNVSRLREGIANNILSEMPASSAAMFGLLDEHLRSPIEISATLYPAPSMLMSAELDFDDGAAFGRFMEQLAVEFPLLALAEPVTNGSASFANTPYPALLRFDANNGRLMINVGPAVTAEGFAALLQGIEDERGHLMQSLEGRLDSSGQGLFVWLDTAQALPMLQLFVAPDDLETFTELGLDKVSAVALGWGVANGKGRLGVVAELPAGSDRGLLPLVENEVGARSVGPPDGLLLLSLPTDAEFARLEALALPRSDAANDDWYVGKQQIADITGVALEEYFAALGPDVSLVFDAAGDYIAVRLRNRRLWTSIVERLDENTAVQIDERRIDGARYVHLSVPSENADADGLVAEADLGWLGEVLMRQRDHFYWTVDRDYLYIASVPQPLIDRRALGARTDVGRWLTDQQRIDPAGALLSISGTSRKLPRRFYDVYIEIMQVLGDLALADVDIWSMPTARQLDLPDVGALGFTVSLGSPLISAELVFENNPTEFLGGLGGIALLGVGAAVAIPAYQDYTTRAQVAEGLALSARVRADVASHHAQTGRFPDEAEAGNLSIFNASEHVQSVVVEAASGRIVVDFTEEVTLVGEQIYLNPEVQANGEIDWSCIGTFEDKHLPAACRP